MTETNVEFSQFINACEERKLILESKLTQVANLRIQIENSYDTSNFQDNLTRSGGVFAFKNNIPPLEEDENLRMYDWIIQNRRFIESLLKELELDIGVDYPDFIREPYSFADLLVALESGDMKSDNELLNRLLRAVNNVALVNREKAENADKIDRILKLILRKYSSS